MATNDDTAPDAAPSVTPPAAAPAPAPAPAASGSSVPKALAITGVAVGSALLLGLTFAGGVALGQALPDGRGPGELVAFGPHGDRDAQLERIGERVEQRMDERMQERLEQRDDR